MDRLARVQIRKCPKCLENDWWLRVPNEPRERTSESLAALPLRALASAGRILRDVAVFFTPWLSRNYYQARALEAANRVAAGEPPPPGTDTAVCANCDYEWHFAAAVDSSSAA